MIVQSQAWEASGDLSPLIRNLLLRSQGFGIICLALARLPNLILTCVMREVIVSNRG